MIALLHGVFASRVMSDGEATASFYDLTFPAGADINEGDYFRLYLPDGSSHVFWPRKEDWTQPTGLTGTITYHVFDVNDGMSAAAVRALAAQKAVNTGEWEIDGYTLQTLPTSDLIGHWPFDEGAGTSALDSSGNEYTGTLFGDPSWVTGHDAAGALLFDGATNYVAGSTAGLNITDQQLTIAGWVKRTGGAALIGTIFAFQRGGTYTYSLGFRGAAYGADENKASASLYDGTENPEAQSAVVIPADEWTHLAMTYDGENLKIYFNGALSATEAAEDIDLATSDTIWRIGANAGTTPERFFTGVIDSIRIFNRALTAAEISALYHLT